jgi:hypothetical protein
LNENGTSGTSSSASPAEPASQVEPAPEGTASQGNLTDGTSLPGNLTEITTSAEQVEEGRFLCYPNPVNNILNLEISSVNPGDYYSLYSVNGQKLASELITSSPSSVDFTGMAPGIYIVVVVSDHKVFMEKIVKI